MVSDRSGKVAAAEAMSGAMAGLGLRGGLLVDLVGGSDHLLELLLAFGFGLVDGNTESDHGQASSAFIGPDGQDGEGGEGGEDGKDVGDHDWSIGWRGGRAGVIFDCRIAISGRGMVRRRGG